MPAERPAKPRTIPEGRQRAKERVRAVQQAAGAVLKQGQEYAAQTPHGVVRVKGLTAHKDGEVEWVEVQLAGETVSGETHYRIFNPPTLASDPAGDVQVNGRRFRYDPLAAVLEAVGGNGGAEQQRKGRRR
jgi:hypothetical protein